jgi:hypothetical protein
LRYEQRPPGTQMKQVCGQLSSQHAAVSLGEIRREIGLMQCSQIDDLQPVTFNQFEPQATQRAVRVPIPAATRHEERQVSALAPIREPKEEINGRLVNPMRILDHQHDVAITQEVFNEPLKLVDEVGCPAPRFITTGENSKGADTCLGGRARSRADKRDRGQPVRRNVREKLAELGFEPIGPTLGAAKSRDDFGERPIGVLWSRDVRAPPFGDDRLVSV